MVFFKNFFSRLVKSTDGAPPVGAYKVIVGLGNPGEKYQKTRHNLGAEAVRAFGERKGLVFKAEAKFQSFIAQGSITLSNGENAKVILLLPQTYMNRSGIAVRKILDFFKIYSSLPNEKLENLPHCADLLVVVDDVYVKFGELRYRPKGTPGGHNGLKSIDAALDNSSYPRLRLGVGPQSKSGDKLELDVPLEVYVLENFSKDEASKIPAFIDKATQTIESWILDDSKTK